MLTALTLPPAADVLDVGAGEGGLLTLLRARGHTGRRLGLDLQARLGVPPGRAEALPFPDHHFDAVFLVRALLHFSDPAGALDEAVRVLRPGGQLIVAVQGADHLPRFWSRYGPPSLGAEVLTARQLTGRAFGRLDVRLPTALTPEHAATIARSYALPPPAWQDTLVDQLHLTVFVHRK